MKTIMSKSSLDSSFSFSSRHFCWVPTIEDENNEDHHVTLTSYPSTRYDQEEKDQENNVKSLVVSKPKRNNNKLQVAAVLCLRSVLNTVFFKKQYSKSRLGNRVVGTVFGNRHGYVRLAFQEDLKSYPAFLIEIAIPTNRLIEEMASGLVRIALECDKKIDKKGLRLLEEPLWRTYCNGKKCGLAMMFDFGPEEMKVLKAIEMISIGAGVLPGSEDGSEGEVMYMRAKFERVVGSKDSEAFYMMNPSGSKGPELSLYLIRV